MCVPFLNDPADFLTRGIQNAPNDEDCSTLLDVDVHFIVAGDPGGEDEPTRKGTALQVSPLVGYRLLIAPLTRRPRQTWLLGYEFPSTLILLQKNRLHILCSPSKGL